ncbi:MAG: IS1182 family transposase [Gemmatimonadetes bacterium]|nr:IS1182 family transposase [Gemmatimonadota bacterium]
MAHYKYIDTNPRFLAVDLARQLLPGTFEHALHHLLSGPIDLSHFDARFRNDDTGAPAYPPATLLQIVLFAYARGVVSSRAIARQCEEHVTFIALCGDQAPHFTTIARFIRTLGADIAPVFAAVLAICDQQGLIGREMFAIDGVKLPSNASKRTSGTRAEFERQAAKLEAAATQMLARHRANDERPPEPDLDAKDMQRRTRLERDAGQLRAWLAAHPDDRRGAKGAIRKSNRTDNESAKMATSKGVIQGYTGVAVVDAKTQIIVAAAAHGTGSEHELLVPMVQATDSVRAETTLITADAGYHSEANLRALATQGIDALIADGDLRRRDARFATQVAQHATKDPLHDKSADPEAPRRFQPADFQYDAAARTCVCPAGKALYRKGQSNVTRGFVAEHFQGAKRDCLPCVLRAQCLRHPERTTARQVAFFRGRERTAPLTHSAQMKARIDTPTGRARYAQCFATVEPVFGNLRHNKRLARFTLRSQAKVTAQWTLFCLVHNIEKLAHYGATA